MTKADLALLSLLDVIAEIHNGELQVTAGTADDLHRALKRLSEIGTEDE